jgi:hypothetical protein
MLKTFSLVCLGLLCSGVLGCAAEVAPTDTADPAPALAEPPAEGQSFAVQLPHDVTTESVIPAIVAAGQDKLAAVCERTPGAGIRIANPLASGAFEDVQCSTILGESEMTEHASTALTSGGERIGQTQQKFSPVGLVCSALLLGATLAWNWPGSHVGCNDPRAENPVGCQAVTSIGGGGLGLLCALI